MPTRGRGERAATGSERTAAAMPDDAKRVRAALVAGGAVGSRLARRSVMT